MNRTREALDSKKEELKVMHEKMMTIKAEYEARITAQQQLEDERRHTLQILEQVKVSHRPTRFFRV